MRSRRRSPSRERIVTIEDAAELQLQQAHVIRLESRPPNIEGEGEVKIRELVRNSLRMRPDRIVVGEVRGAETLDMLQAMNTGHEGSLTTIHANSPRDALNRLETLVLMSGLEIPLHAIREQISSALDLIVHITRLVDGSRRISHVTEVLGMESAVITLQDVFAARPVSERAAAQGLNSYLRPLTCTGLQPHFQGKLAAQGVILPDDFYQPDFELVAGRGGGIVKEALFDTAWGPIALALSVGCLTLLATLVALGQPRSAWLKGRIDVYGQGGAAVAGPAGRALLAARHGSRSTGRPTACSAETRLWQSLERMAERANVGWRPSEIVAWSVAAAIAAGLVVMLLLVERPARGARRRRRADDAAS